MNERVRNDDNLSCEVRVEEYLDIKAMIDEFGDVAYPAVLKYYLSCGYESRYDLLVTLLKEEAVSREAIVQDPSGSLLLLLQEFFTKRSGNQPVFSRNGDTVSFKTESNLYCPSPVAQNQTGVQHRDVCAIHKRAFMEGVAKVLQEFVPGIEIQYSNVSSRTIDPQADCVEAFHVVCPW
jgi:hypothetical protein